MKCCGEERTTAYCPDCGKHLGQASPLHQLLSHVRQRIKSQLSEIGSWNTHSPNNEGTAKRKKTVAKWQAWADALVEAIKQSERAAP